jgi:hypothetical protein
VMPRFLIALLAAILFQSLHSVAMPTIVSAAEQEPPSRHSLIHRSDAGSSAPPATTHGTILQPSSAEPTHITSPIEPHKPSVSISPAPIPAPHHRTLTKRPPIATITAPATLSQTPPPAAPVSGIADGQATQATAETAKNTAPTTTAPVNKATAAPLTGVISSGTAAVAPSASSPVTGAAGLHPAASAGSGSAPSTGGSRSAANLLQNSAIMSLLAPSTPVVTTPPPPPSTPPVTPPATPPSTPPPSSPSTGNVTLTWAANSEPDLAGYKIYVGAHSGTYSFPGSPFVTGKITSYTISNLPKGETYYFAISAYDSAGNESALSAEVSRSLY